MVEVHQVHYKNNSLLELDFYSKRDRRAACKKDNPVTAALVFDKPYIQNKEPDPPRVTNHYFRSQI